MKVEALKLIASFHEIVRNLADEELAVTVRPPEIKKNAVRYGVYY